MSEPDRLRKSVTSADVAARLKRVACASVLLAILFLWWGQAAAGTYRRPLFPGGAENFADKRELQFSLRYEHQHSGKALQDDGVCAVNPTGEVVNFRSLVFDLRYGLGSRLNLIASLPYLSNQSVDQGTSYDRLNKGFGDLAMTAEYCLGSSPQLTLGAGVKFPTANIESTDELGQRIADNLTLGTGTTDALVGAGFWWPRFLLENVDLRGSLWHRFSGGENKWGYSFGDRTRMNVHGSLPLSEHWRLGLRAEGVHTDPDTWYGNTVPDRGATMLYLGPTLSWNVAEGFAIGAYANFPVVMKLEGTQLVDNNVLGMEFTSDLTRYFRRDNWSDDEFDDEEGTARSFLYKEVVLSGFYSRDGFVVSKQFEPTPRPPGNYIGVEYVRTFDSSSFINKRLLPNWFPLGALDLRPRLVYNAMEPSGSNDRVEFAPQDFWLRFNPGARDRLALLVGQFVLPYGVNPVLAPRQRFILPVEAVDLGLKWDWGLAVKGPIGEYDWELATTLGSGEVLYPPYLFEDSPRTSYLITGRVGAPTYWDIQYGISGLFGEMPMTRWIYRMSDIAISRWRVGLDTFWRAGTYLMAGAQLTYGQNGFDNEPMIMESDVLGYQVWADWVVPWHLDLRLATQFLSLNRNLDMDVKDTSWIFEANYSFANAVSLMLDYRVEFSRSMGEKDNAFFVTFIYYG